MNTSNADMGPAEIREYCKLDEAEKVLRKTAMTQLQRSARAFTAAEAFGPTEALPYRPATDVAMASRMTTVT